MPNARYMARMERVLATRVTQQRKIRRRPVRRLSGIAAALMAATACFFLLKAATLAYFGTEQFASLAAPLAQGEGLESLRFWLAGPDPVSGFLADALAPGNTDQAAMTDTGAGEN